MNFILPFSDVVAPNIVSGPSFRSVTSNSVVVEWQTNEPSRGSVKTGSRIALAEELATTHSVLLDGLTPSTAYAIEISATDAAGNGPTVATGNVTTLAIADSLPPVILEGPVISGSTASGLVVEWTTNEPAKGAVAYGPANAGLGASVAETALAVAHRVELGGLVANTEYKVRVTATDAAGNGPVTSRIATGRTRSAADLTGPAITHGPLISDISETGASVEWRTDEPSTGGISWNDGTVYDLITETKLRPIHRVRIGGLKAATTYHLTVSSRDAEGNGPSLSKTVDFSTAGQADTTAPQIIGSPEIVTVTHQSAVIRWETDEPADSQVSYGTTALDQTDSRAPLTRKHNLPLVGLLANTTYQVRVGNRDQAGNLAAPGALLTFTTLASPDTALPVFEAPPAVGYVSDTRAVVQWKTDKVADSQVTITDLSFEEPPRIRASGLQDDQHDVALTGLTPGKSYRVEVATTDLLGNSSTQSFDFATPPQPDAELPQIVVAPAVSPSATTAVVTWTTDKLADSRANYGTLGQALNQTSGQVAYKRQHRVVLTKLKPSTAYQVQVSSTDPEGKQALATPLAFTTQENGGNNANTGNTGTTTTTSPVTTTTVDSTTTTTAGGGTGGTVDGSAAAVDLLAGWNLVGNGQAQTLDVAASLGNPGLVTSVWSWIASQGAWAFYAPSLTPAQLEAYAASKGYTVLSQVQAGEGFWVNAKAAFSFPLPGGMKTASSRFAASGTHPLPAGWSLVATGDHPTPPVFNAALSGASPTTSPAPLNLTTLWAWDTPQSGWYFWAPSLYNAGTLHGYLQSKEYLDFTTTGKMLSPTTGFWVNKPQ